MNYYEHFLGDYSKKTSHLRMAGHGAYRMLLDHYYSTERALPASQLELYVICKAMNKADQATVRSVADEFFPVGPDGKRHNERADAEISRAVRRMTASRENGKTGGRKPRRNPEANLDGTQQEPSGNLEANLDRTQKEPRSHNVPQPGEALPHAPDPIPKSGGLSEFPTPEAPRLPGTLTATTWREWRAHLANRGKAMTPQSERLQLVRLAGHSDPEAVVQSAIEGGYVSLKPVGGYADKKQDKGHGRATVAGEIFGEKNDGRIEDPHDITGEAKRIA